MHMVRALLRFGTLMHILQIILLDATEINDAREATMKNMGKWSTLIH